MHRSQACVSKKAPLVLPLTGLFLFFFFNYIVVFSISTILPPMSLFYVSHSFCVLDICESSCGNPCHPCALIWLFIVRASHTDTRAHTLCQPYLLMLDTVNAICLHFKLLSNLLAAWQAHIDCPTGLPFSPVPHSPFPYQPTSFCTREEFLDPASLNLGVISSFFFPLLLSQLWAHLHLIFLNSLQPTLATFSVPEPLYHCLPPSIPFFLTCC